MLDLSHNVMSVERSIYDAPRVQAMVRLTSNYRHVKERELPGCIQDYDISIGGTPETSVNRNEHRKKWSSRWKITNRLIQCIPAVINDALSSTGKRDSLTARQNEIRSIVCRVCMVAWTCLKQDVHQCLICCFGKLEIVKWRSASNMQKIKCTSGQQWLSWLWWQDIVWTLLQANQR